MVESVRALFEATCARRRALASLATNVLTGERPCLRLPDRTGATLILSRSLAPDKDLRLTRFENGVPVGHVEYVACEAGMAQVIRDLAGVVSVNPTRTRDADLPATGSFHG